MTGRLVMVATPIGNLGDLSPRAQEMLERADAVACEDTRRTRKLFAHAGVPAPPLLVVNEHTEFEMTDRLVQRMQGGEVVVLVSDAGMPAISDPGEQLVRAVVEAGIGVEVVPGPSAVVSALALSGLSTRRFCFEGFLPRRGTERQERLRLLAGEQRTVVLFESPHRIDTTLHDLAEVMGADRRIAVARELTKLHEEVFRGTLADAEEWAQRSPRGELVLVIDGATAPAPPGDDAIVEAVRAEVAAGASHAEAARAVATHLGVRRRRVYELTLDR